MMTDYDKEVQCKFFFQSGVVYIIIAYRLEPVFFLVSNIYCTVLLSNRAL